MFLNLMNKPQKELFMELAIKAAEVNGVVELEEKNMLKAYAIEMQIHARYKTERETEEILNSLLEITCEKERRIIVFEILGMMFSDGVYDEKEEQFVKYISDKAGMSIDDIMNMISVLKEYEKVYKKICDVVMI